VDRVFTFYYSIFIRQEHDRWPPAIHTVN
jgi:hypothetical protein